jgi:ubiquinone/menaquinone biosynthesis C-methylase UbiE
VIQRVYAYCVFRIKLVVATLLDLIDHRTHGAVPIPTAKLRHRVHGRLSRRNFLQTGGVIAQNIRDLVASVDRDFNEFEHVLDFGCGCGRVVRNFLEIPGTGHLYGSDIDSELINWCKKNMPQIQCSVNGYEPPLKFDDATFDLIYAISVFTHLDEVYQHKWLRELQRVAKPGALIILTVHGESVIQQLDQAFRQKIHARGFFFDKGATGKLKLDGLPDFYQTAYHSGEYIDREWAAYFEILRHAEHAINNHQDAVILKKR